MPMTRMVAILGAGPAGLSCALWLKNLGLQPWLIDTADHAGGMMRYNFLSNNWVLGQQGQTGVSLGRQFVDHIAAESIAMSLAARQISAQPDKGVWRVACHAGDGVQGHECAAVVLATGSRYRGLEDLGAVPGVAALGDAQLGIGPHAFAQLAAQKDRAVLIVGGGDNAIENARLLLEQGAQVTLLARSAFRAQAHLMEAVTSYPAVQLCLGVLQRVAITANGRVAATFTSGEGAERTLEVDRIHLLLGYEPNSDVLAAVLGSAVWQCLPRDAQGYLQADSFGRCAVAGLYAAGDVCNPAFPSVVSALAQGALVAKTIERDLRLGGVGSAA